MAYTTTNAFVGRGTILSYEVGSSFGFVNLVELRDIKFSGNKLDTVDVTNYDSQIFREFISTLVDSGNVTFAGNYIPSDTGQKALMGFINAASLVNWRVTLPNALGLITFAGYLVGLDHELPNDKQATISATVKITGAVQGF